MVKLAHNGHLALEVGDHLSLDARNVVHLLHCHSLASTRATIDSSVLPTADELAEANLTAANDGYALQIGARRGRERCHCRKSPTRALTTHTRQRGDSGAGAADVGSVEAEEKVNPSEIMDRPRRCVRFLLPRIFKRRDARFTWFTILPRFHVLADESAATFNEPRLHRAVHLNAHGKERALSIVFDVCWARTHQFRQAIETLALTDEQFVLIYRTLTSLDR